jgi:hypothetical protein
MPDITTSSVGFGVLQKECPVQKPVILITADADDSVTAAITAGASYFAISKIEVCNAMVRPGAIGQKQAIGLPSGTVATSDGTKPLAVKTGQCVQLWVTANLSQDVVVPAELAGAAELKGSKLSKSVSLTAVPAGQLIGKILVQPQTPAPGESVLVQVCDATGKPLSDPSIVVTMQGVPATSRYYQFATAGNRTLVIYAARGQIRETTTVKINVAGPAKTFHTSVNEPALTALPYLMAKHVLGQPYTVTLSLGNPSSVRRVQAKGIAAMKQTGVKLGTAAAKVIRPSPPNPLSTNVEKSLSKLPAEKIVKDTPPPIKNSATVATHSSLTGPAGALPTVKPEATSYRWDFGDGQSITTQAPTVTHDYFGAIQPDKVAHSFHVSCTAMHDNVTVKRTLVVHSAYGMCRQYGVAVPHVTGDVYASYRLTKLNAPALQTIGTLSANLTVHNPETTPMVIEQVAYVPLSDGTSETPPAPRFAKLPAAVTVPARGVATLSASIGEKELKTAAPANRLSAYAAHYSGELRPPGAKPVPVRFSRVFRVPLSIGGAASNLKRAEALVVNPTNAPAVAEGQECYPDAISDADAVKAAAEQLVCQLTGQPVSVTVPGQFQNALQGDVILSPAPVGGGDLIAAMFNALIPPQHHGHSGLMTLNFYEITHCTATPQRMMDNMNKDSVGIPTSFNGSMLQYGWPGSMTQSIDDATSNLPYKDPGATTYYITSFNTDVEGDGFELIPPLVVKPLPENEAAVRPLLRKAGETGRSKGARYDAKGNLTQKGGCYYSFYCYTKPEISAGFIDKAAGDAGWAQGLSPAVCSSFCWLCMKENNIPLVSANKIETLSDFTNTAVEAGAAVDGDTLDGLTYYSESERQAGAQALYQGVLNQALSQEDGLGTIPGINPDIAGPIADQLLNTFAFGDPNMVGSSAWQSPGDGNAVSPDNVQFWNPPYFGYAEPLQYLPPHTEEYTESVWKKVISHGSIKGKVTLNGQPVAQAQVWVFMSGGETMTGADGSYTLNNIPIGTYALQARIAITKNGVTIEYQNDQTGLQGDKITLTAAQPNLAKDIVLGALPDNFRRLDVTMSVSCDHGDDSPFNAHGVENAGPFAHSAFVNPGRVQDSTGYTFDYHEGGYFNIGYNFVFDLKSDGSVQTTVTATMKDDGSGNVQDAYSLKPFTVARDGSWQGVVNLEHSGGGYHNGPAKLTFHIANVRQTG